MEKFQSAIDSLLNERASTATICEYLSHCYYNASTKERPSKQHLPPSILLKISTGDCIDYSRLGVHLGRTFGLPVVCDFVPNWGKTAGWHQWCTLLHEDGSQTPFSIAAYETFGEHVANSITSMAKVFRRTTTINYESLAMQGLTNIPVIFQDPYIKDVSNLYFDAIDIHIELDYLSKSKQKIAYIMVFDGTIWKPVDWSYTKKSKCCFRNISPSCLYMVMYYIENIFIPASYPFHLDKNNNIVKLIPDSTSTKSIELKRKNFTQTNRYAKHLIGGKFQIGNSPDFKDAIDIHVIDTIIGKSKQIIEIEQTVPHKYFRYIAPYNSTGYIAEIEVYDEEQNLLSGDIIGTDGSYAELGNDKYKVFDENIYTFFDAPINKNVWVGIAFNRPKNIHKIVYYPRYDDSEIKKEDKYELFYWDKRWKYIGYCFGDEERQSVTFSCPANALYLLKNTTRNQTERIFTYENGKQVWW